MGLMGLVKHGQAARARLCITHLLRREPDPIELKQFDSLRYQLFQTGGQVFEDWIVSWLLDGDFTLCGAMNDTLFGAGTEGHAFQIDFTRFDLRASDYPYVARKAIGTFFLRPLLAASLLVSLLRTAPMEVVQEIIDLLVDPILMNYSGVASEFLEPIAADDADPASAHTRRALEVRMEYLEGLRSIGIVPELHPSERERRMERQLQSDRVAVAFREARRQSIIASIATESVMLHGTRSVSWVNDDAGTMRRIETPLASLEHSIEMPRVEIVDLLGLQLMLIHFRGEMRPT